MVSWSIIIKGIYTGFCIYGSGTTVLSHKSIVPLLVKGAGRFDSASLNKREHTQKKPNSKLSDSLTGYDRIMTGKWQTLCAVHVLITHGILESTHFFRG